MSTAFIPCGQVLSGTIPAISSKSELHRMLICAAFSKTPSSVRCSPILSKDIEATISCLTALGARIDISPGEIRITKPVEHKITKHGIVLDCHESGSTARFFLPYCTMFCQNAVLTGQGKLPERPMKDLCQCLEEHGAVFSGHALPITIEACADRNGTFTISGNVSSQYLTGLLLTLPFVNGNIKLSTELHSSGYVDITTDVMRRYGVYVNESQGTYTACGSYTAPQNGTIAFGDWSNAAFFLCGAALGGNVTLTQLDASSRQPDRAVIDVLHLFGANVEIKDFTVIVSKNKCFPFDINAENIPDLVPILAVMACGAVGETTIRNITRLRVKESDRADAVFRLITGLGGEAKADENNLYIYGTGKLRGGTVQSFNDHRIAMCAAIAAVLCREPVVIEDCMAVTKSYPEFYQDYMKLMEAQVQINP